MSAAPDPILLSLLSQRFMGIAEACGAVLALTSVSTNIRERLDYSCGVFDAQGELVANAPHLPVHLGSMSFAVKAQIAIGMQEGDVVISNHPAAGGSHLPDITVITPVFKDGRVLFFTACRGHHADVGGILPGSMPPTSKCLLDEGAAIKSFKLVKAGEFQREELRRLMVDVPAQQNFGCRCFADVESDLRAQISANRKGEVLIGKLIDEYGEETVMGYMGHIRDNAEQSVRSLLKRIALSLPHAPGKLPTLSSIDYLDNGSPIALLITLDPSTGNGIFDFEGTGREMIGNLNAPVAVTYAAVIYCLRALLGMEGGSGAEIPLNQGCLVPITILLPEGSLLNPSETAAVVGGNVCTSQRVTDVILSAFSACAQSQGDCNNHTFGNSNFGYYETIAGGTGAGKGWDGTTSQSHMTNTRITDPETLERRYPCLLWEFGRRKGSGGKGEFVGGEGAVREVEFLEEMQVSILSERRVFAPSGLLGGGSGGRGVNTWIKQRRAIDGDMLEDAQENAVARVIDLGGKASVKMGKGDRIRIETPGGGGWGHEKDRAVV